MNKSSKFLGYFIEGYTLYITENTFAGHDNPSNVYT